MTISNSAILSNATMYLKGIIQTLTDPVSGSRPTDSRYVMTSFPQRQVYYPLIIIEVELSDRDLGMATEGKIVSIFIRISIFSKSAQQRDQIFDQVYNLLRTSQLTDGSSVSTLSEGLYDFKLINSFNLDEDVGQEKIHRKIMEVGYKYIIAS